MAIRPIGTLSQKIHRRSRGDRAAHNRAGDEDEPDQAAEDPQCPPALFQWERRAQERHRQRHHQRRTSSRTARAVISQPALPASAHPADAATNRPRPATSMRRRPNRSRRPSRLRAASASWQRSLTISFCPFWQNPGDRFLLSTVIVSTRTTLTRYATRSPRRCDSNSSSTPDGPSQ
jgi:hypothetical protein